MDLPNSSIILDLVLKSSAVLLLAFAVQSLWRHASAARRSFLWLATFAVLALLPLTLLVTPRLALDWLPQKKVAPPAPALPEIKVSATPLESAPVPQPILKKPATPLSPGETVAAIWLLGAVLVLAYRVAGAVRLRHLLRRVTPIENASVQSRASELALDCGITRDITLLQSDFVQVPVTWGTIRPTLLLPEASLQWENARLDAALRHELGHIRHLDSLKRLFAHTVCAVHWFNPLVWFAAKSWHTAQEQACDDFVLRGGADAESYAMQLLGAAQAFGASGLLPASALAMAQPSTLETRLTSIVDGSRDRRPLSRALRITGAVSGLLVLAVCASMQLRAADKPQAKTAAGVVGAPEIRIEARIVEAPVGTLGSILGGVRPAPGVAAITSVNQTDEMFKKLQATKGVDLLSAPKVTTRSGQKATIEIGKEVPVDPKDPNSMAFEGVKIGLLPTLKEGVIDLEMDASVSRKVSEDKSRPVMRSRSVAAIVRLESGSTALFVTGDRFKQSGSTELLFFITASLAPQNHQAEAKPAPDGKSVTVTDDSIKVDQNTKTVLASGGVKIENAHGTGKGETATIQVPAQPVVAKTAAQKRAETIIFPRIVFHEASPDEALEFLRIKGRELDPEKQGVNTLLIHGPDSRSAKLTLDLRNVPLSEALRYVAQLAGLDLEAQDDAMVVKPAAPKAK